MFAFRKPLSAGYNIKMYRFSAMLKSYTHDVNNNIWNVFASVDDNNKQISIADNDLIAVFIWEDIWNGQPEWVALPFNHHYNGGEIFNQHLFSYDPSNKRLWLAIRNSTGITPYQNMTTSSNKLYYKIFVASAGLTGCDCKVDFSDYDSIMKCIENSSGK